MAKKKKRSVYVASANNASRPKWPKALVKQVFDKGEGKCWHCGKAIAFEHRKVSDGEDAWHIDHHPVPYRDIEGQCCIGVTDPMELSNLVPSCVACNVSHQHEVSECVYCGRSQMRCHVGYWVRFRDVLAGFLVGSVLTGIVVYA